MEAAVLMPAVVLVSGAIALVEGWRLRSRRVRNEHWLWKKRRLRRARWFTGGGGVALVIGAVGMLLV